jgi:hypothetical protein
LGEGDQVFEATDEPGIYEVLGLQPPFRFAVNLDPAESRTALRPVEELERLQVPMRVTEEVAPVSTDRKIQLHQAELESRQKLWRWLIVSALVVLIVETLVSRWLSRGRPATKEALT